MYANDDVVGAKRKLDITIETYNKGDPESIHWICYEHQYAGNCSNHE